MAKSKKPKVSPIDEEIMAKCIAIVDQERTNWEEAVTFVTEKVAFRMRELIRIMRKNYWGVFDEPFDKQTGREKVWIGLVMSTIETWVKNIDIGQKDIGFIARFPKGVPITELTRLVVRDYLDRMYFGEILDTDERQCLIDGTLVWKTWESTNEEGEVVMNRRTVDLLNIYIDPTEDNIQKAYRFTERSLMLPSQIEGMTGWLNTTGLDGSQTLNKIDGNRRANFGTKTTADYRDVWEMWGKMPQWLITKDKKAEDANLEIDGHIIISGLEAGDPVMHLCEKNTKKDKFGKTLKPYEELRPCKISGRWYGLGVAERILALQEYLNTIINIRINRGYISQLGLFKIKKGKGITAQMLNRLPVNGAIQVSDMDDVQQMAVSEAGQSSYNDEEVIKYWSQQMSSAQPISSGEILPASSTATSAAISNANAKSAYTMFKEAVGSFLERWIDRHAIGIIAKTIDVDEIVRLTNSDEQFKELAERIALYNVNEALENGNVIPTQEELMATLDAEVERLRNSPQIFIQSTQQIVAEMIDTKAHITNEDLDTSVTIANLLQLVNIAPEYRDGIVRQIYDLMGLSVPKSKPQMAAPAGSPMEMSQPSATDIMSQAQGVNG